jgi:Flp pilus assembly pilin Flp
MNIVKRLIREEEGQDIIEYVLIAGAISVIAIPTLPALGAYIGQLWVGVDGQVQSVPIPGGGGS